ncbi:class I SAM-dependent methyltransferase [Acuticoccus sp.]|uniref:class I SAM-dependent methyltransferase n=1 Tax=Acuticoccus sp. TaxID=1904378 RepID=UPI003B520E85
MSGCPACGSREVSAIYRIEGIPVQSCILLDSEAEARAFPRGDMELMFCDACGLVFNAIFDLARVDYGAATEESQHFSNTFNRFAARLIDDIAATYELSGRRTLEIGCGKGDFLIELARRTGTRATGIDPGFLPGRATAVEGDVAFVKAYFTPSSVAAPPDFIVCRHTLEHVPAVGDFMSDVREVLDGQDDGALFFETPDVARVLVEGAFWDIYYEHCSYFTLGSHARLFRAAGLDVTRLHLDFDDQYIIQHARVGGAGTPLAQEDDLAELRRHAAAFPAHVARVRARWRDFVSERARAGKRVALWGGGSKAVAFLTTCRLDEEVAAVVDINPHKQGKHLAGAGHRVCAPEELVDAAPDTVIAMNAVYREEIAAQLAGLGLSAELVAL